MSLCVAYTMSQDENRPVTTAVFILVYGYDENLAPTTNQSFLTIDVLVCSSYTVRGKEETKLISLFPCLFDLTDARIVEQLQEVCASAAENNTQSLESVFFGTSPSQVLYFLEVRWRVCPTFLFFKDGLEIQGQSVLQHIFLANTEGSWNQIVFFFFFLAQVEFLMLI